MKSFADFYNAPPDLALVPGSFKPPHKGHYEMVKQYAGIADDVIVLISAPSAKSERKTKTGKIITPEVAQEIFSLYVSNLRNVTIEISTMPSPVGAVYDALENLGGKRIILGASKKDNDWKRWAGASDYVKKKGYNIDIVDPEGSAVDIVTTMTGRPYSASNIRDNFDNPAAIAEDLPDHVDPKKVNDILSLL